MRAAAARRPCAATVDTRRRRVDSRARRRRSWPRASRANTARRHRPACRRRCRDHGIDDHATGGAIAVDDELPRVGVHRVGSRRGRRGVRLRGRDRSRGEKETARRECSTLHGHTRVTRRGDATSRRTTRAPDWKRVVRRRKVASSSTSRRHRAAPPALRRRCARSRRRPLAAHVDANSPHARHG